MLALLLGFVLSHSVAAQPNAPAPAAAEPPAGKTSPSAESADRLTRWQADLDHLATELPAKHKNAFFRCTREQWETRVAEIRAKLPELSDAEALVALRQLVAMLGDGHCNVWADRQSTLAPSRQYPIACAWLSDGIYPAVLPREHEKLIGQRLVAVGGKPINEVIDRVALVQAFDNASGRKNQTMATLREADTLAALGIVKDVEASEWTLADADGNETVITVAPIPPDANPALLMVQKPEPGELGFSRVFRREPYGHKLLEDTRTLYVWYDTCADSGSVKVSEFCEDTLTALDAGLAAEPPAIDRVVIDLRRNSGGNSLLLAPLIDGLARRERINQKGKLYALIGRRTFSSAMMNAYQLTNATKCLLVGEPTGGTPNGYGEVKQFRLPNSKLNVQYSTKLFKGPKPGDAVLPDIAADADAAAYFDPKRDAVLEAAIGHR